MTAEVDRTTLAPRHPHVNETRPWGVLLAAGRHKLLLDVAGEPLVRRAATPRTCAPRWRDWRAPSS